MRVLARLGVAAYAVVMFAVFFASLAVPAASAQTPPQIPQLSFNVTNSVFKVIVYPDGAVSPVYSLEATARLGTSLSGNIVLESQSSYTGKAQETRTVIHVDLSGLKGVERVNASVAMEGGYWFEKGSGEAKLHLIIKYLNVNKGESVSIEVGKARLSLEKGKKASVMLEVTLPRELLEKKGNSTVTQKIPNVDEINRKLAENGFRYVKVEELSLSMLTGGRARARIVASIDLDEMLQVAEQSGLSREDADTIRQLLDAPYRVEGSLKLFGKLVSGQGRLQAGLSYTYSSKGDLEEMATLFSKASSSVSALAAALLQPLLAKNPETAIVVSQVRASTGLAAGQLLEKPPSKSSTKLVVSISNGYAKIRIEYNGGRLYAPSSTPSGSAEKALAVISTQYQQVLTTLSQLEILIPGISRSLPTVVELEPAAACIKISKTRITAAQLAAVKIDLSGCQEKTTTTATTNTTEASSTLVVTSTTSPKMETSTATLVKSTPTTISQGEGQTPETATQTTTATAATTTVAATASTAPATTPQAGTGKQQGGGGSTLALAALAVIVAVAAAALLLRR